MKEVLIIPDCHATPEHNNDRMEWAGKFALHRKPDLIIDLGDRASMHSLSSYDVGKVQAEGRRYGDDIASAIDATQRFNKPIDDYNKKRGVWKKKKYNPKKVICLGNHEHRIIRASEEDPRLHGHLSIDDLQYEEYGWEVIPFLDPYEYEGIVFKHYFTSGIMGRPIGGENHAASLVKKNFTSCVVGHSHMRSFWETTNALGRNIFGLCTGCYFDYDEHYTKENNRFWRGLIYLHDVEMGQAEPEFLHIDYLRRRYDS